jgi:hypothetical protein
VSLRPPASAASIGSTALDDLDASDAASGTTAVPRRLPSTEAEALATARTAPWIAWSSIWRESKRSSPIPNRLEPQYLLALIDRHLEMRQNVVATQERYRRLAEARLNRKFLIED